MNWECRIAWNRQDSNFSYFSDFYTENPETYYHSGTDITPDGRKIHITVTENAKADEKPNQDDSGIWTLRTKTNPVSLRSQTSNEQIDSWWKGTRPLFIQTDSLGPIKTQRINKGSEPQPDYRGCRLITVSDNLINRIHYVRVDEMKNTLSLNNWFVPVLHMMR